MLLPSRDALRHEVGGEKLGERRSDRLEQASISHKIHIRVAGKSYPGQNQGTTSYLGAIEPHTLREAQPDCQPSFAFFFSVVIVNAPDPSAAEPGIFGL